MKSIKGTRKKILGYGFKFNSRSISSSLLEYELNYNYFKTLTQARKEWGIPNNRKIQIFKVTIETLNEK